MSRPAWVQEGHRFTPEPQWGLLPTGYRPLCDSCGQRADQPHTEQAPPRVPITEQTEPRRYYGD